MLYQVIENKEWSLVETNDLFKVLKYVERLAHFGIPVLVETHDCELPGDMRYSVSVPHEYKYDLLQIQIGFGY